MRTTITLDDDLFQVLEREANTRRISFKEMVNSTLRRGLALEHFSATTPKTKVVTKPFGGGLLPGIDPDRMNQLYDELEVESFLMKVSKDKARS